MQRFALALALGFLLQAGLWYAWIWAQPDPDPYRGLFVAVACLYLGPLVIACGGLAVYFAFANGSRAGGLEAARPEALRVRRGAPVFLGLLLGGGLGSYAVTSGGA